MSHVFCLMGMKRTQNGAFGRVAGLWMIDRVNKEGETKDVGKEDEFLDHGLLWDSAAYKIALRRSLAYLANIGADLTYSGQKLQTRHPFLRTQPRLSCEVMEMSDQPFKDISQPLI